MEPYQQAHALISAAITTVVLAALVLAGHPIAAIWSWLAGSGFYALREGYQIIRAGVGKRGPQGHVEDWLAAHSGATLVSVIYFVALVVSP